VFPQFSEAGTWKASVLLKDAVGNRTSYSYDQLVGTGLSSRVVVIQPSLASDGSVGASGGSVADSVFGTRAVLTVPPGVFSQSTTVAIDVLQSPVDAPLPSGFSSAETYFVNIELGPPPAFPLPAPGISVVLPLRNYTIPGTVINLYRLEPLTGAPVPALDIAGSPVTGVVDGGGMTATFHGVARFSTLVGLLRGALTVGIDIKPGESPNSINTKSAGSIPVAIFSTVTFDATLVNPSTLHLSGAPVVQNRQGKWQFAVVDVNGDGLNDLVAHFATAELLLGPADTQAVVEGWTRDGRNFRGTDTVRILK